MLILACAAASAAPARNSIIYLKQPDGTVFQARMKGDEFTKIKTDAEGHAIIQDADGWWHYAIYSTDGNRRSSGWKVGSHAPAEIMSASRNIPYGDLTRSARTRRAAGHMLAEVPFLRSIREQRDIQTRNGSETGPVTKHGLVILANFKDVKFKHTRQEFENMLNQQGYSVNGATGSAKEYFDAQFNGMMEFDFHVSDIITLPRNRSYYGSNNDDGTDKAPAEMVADACELVDDMIDFSLYDDDNDGDVDNVFIFFAGQDEAEGASEECIWSHAWFIRSGADIKLELDGTAIDRYACTSELSIATDAKGEKYEFISGIGTFCHEYSHTLGLPDFYDTDYEESGGITAGFWTRTSLMDGGNYNNLGNTPPYYNALERLIAGISEPMVLNKTGTYTLEPVHVNGDSYMLPDGSDRFYLFECRAYHDWDKHIGGTGMLAYHIDLSDGGYSKWLVYNDVNINPLNQKADLLEADGRSDSFNTMDDFVTSRQRITGIFYPYEETDFINAGGENTITSIKKTGDIIRFNFLNSETETPPYAVNITKEVFADAAIIRFESNYPYEDEATVIWGRSGQEKDSLRIMPYETGRYAAILENLESAGKTYETDIVFISNEIEGETKRTSVITKRMTSAGWPYIYLGSMERNDDGTFNKGTRSPLRVYGATGAAEIRWEFNGKPITHEGDGYYTLNESGVLQATIFWEDGSIDKVMKQITISL